MSVVSIALASVHGCKCGDDNVSVQDPCEGVKDGEPGRTVGCATTADCRDQFICDPQDNKPGVACCVATSRKCSTEADCCPGQRCPDSKKVCSDVTIAAQDTECVDDASCNRIDTYCLPWTNALGKSVKRCQFRACDAQGQCEPGLSCFQGECLAQPPCNGSCPQGKACLAKADFCQDYPCAATCAPGYIATFKDANNAWNFCLKPQVACECAELPILHSNDLGRYSSIAAHPTTQELWVSHYDGQYGDLVVSKFGTNGTLLASDYVDGVPDNAKVTWGPSGARGGTVELGTNVGRYTDIAFTGGRAFVSYYDVTGGDLKLAKSEANGSWTRMTLDGANADLGLYSTLAVDSDGLLGIAYFQKGASSSFDFRSCPAPAPTTGNKMYLTALKFAKAKVLNPASASDFAVTTLACLVQEPPCTACADTCVDPSGDAVPGCYNRTSGCTGCSEGDVCVNAGGSPTCASAYAPTNLQELPLGVGMHPSLVFRGKDATIVYLRRTGKAGALYGVTLSGTGTRTGPSLLDAQEDTGFFPDAKVKPGTRELWVTYFNKTDGTLRLYKTDTLTNGTTSVIDNGVLTANDGNIAAVGADSSLTFDSKGQALIAYQDTTRTDLRLIAQRGAGWEKLQPLRSEGAVGFFAKGVVRDSTLFVSHGRLRAKKVGGMSKVMNTLELDQYVIPK